MVRQRDATMQPTPQDDQLMSKHRVLGFKPQLRLEWRGQDGQHEPEQPDHPASLSDSITSSTRIGFSVHTVEAEFGRVEVLFNCIGVNPNTPALEIPAEEWQTVMNVNVNGQFYAAQAFARQVARHGGGSIVAIGSNSGVIVDKPQPQAHYNTSKAAVHQMVKSLAVELAPHNIRVNAVAPGYVLTEMTKRGLSTSEWVKLWEEMTPMRRFAEPSEVAYTMLFLASDAASYVTGSILLVDGGYTCW